MDEGTCEQWIKEDKHAVEWMRLSCHQFKDNALRLALFVLAHNLGSFFRRLALPEKMARVGQAARRLPTRSHRRDGTSLAPRLPSDRLSAERGLT